MDEGTRPPLCHVTKYHLCSRETPKVPQDGGTEVPRSNVAAYGKWQSVLWMVGGVSDIIPFSKRPDGQKAQFEPLKISLSHFLLLSSSNMFPLTQPLLFTHRFHAILNSFMHLANAGALGQRSVAQPSLPRYSSLSIQNATDYTVQNE